MPIGYRTQVAVTSLCLALAVPAQATNACRSSAQPALAAPNDLYSMRALRRARRILEFHLLELRKAELERVRSTIARRLPPDTLFEGTAEQSLKHSNDSRVICER